MRELLEGLAGRAHHAELGERRLEGEVAGKGAVADRALHPSPSPPESQADRQEEHREREREHVVTPRDVARLRLVTASGSTVLLSEVATIERLDGQPIISREDLRETVSVTARTEGTDLGSAVRDVRAALDAPGALRSGVSYGLGGLYGEQQRSFSSLTTVFVAATGLLFITLFP